jgi:hypothetical protein
MKGLMILTVGVACVVLLMAAQSGEGQILYPDKPLALSDASFIGEGYDDQSGYSVSSAGDVNRDGYDDILVGARQNDEGGSYAGQTYLIFGKSDGWSMDTPLDSADASFIGEAGGDMSGWSVSSAGDVNGDGYDDILIGAYNNQTYLVFGKATGWSRDFPLSLADASFIGEAALDCSGLCVSSAGDVNGDGYDDILIGARGNDEGVPEAGQTYLIFGKETGWSIDTPLDSADASFIGEADYDYSGFSVSSAGDVNGDGCDDMLIGAYGNDERNLGAGQTYLIFGKSDGWSMDFPLDCADASFIGEAANDMCGWSVCSAGDVNGDGYDDILIGAVGNDEGGSAAGQTYLILGKETGWSIDTPLDSADASFIGEADYNYSGFSVSSAGDVNGDGYDDMLIGASRYGSYTGQSYLIFGKPAGWSMDVSLSLADASFIGEAANDMCGWSVSSAGDVDRDGYDDILIGAHLNSEGGHYHGQTYLNLGVAVIGRPVADAGPDQSIRPGDTVYLDGSGSFDDDTSPDDLEYAWTLIVWPEGSSATLSDADTVKPNFLADLLGTYAVSLVVTDEGALASEPDTVEASSYNNAPTAHAGADRAVPVGQVVQLDGTESSDPEDDPLTYAWSMTGAPEGSAALLISETTDTPTFVPDLVGQYTVQLIVNDGFEDSEPDEVVVSAITAEDFAQNNTMEALNTVMELPPASVMTQGNQTALGNFQTQAIAALQAGDIEEAINKLTKALERTDGCVLRGEPDGPGPGMDWITDCAEQQIVYWLLKDALDAIASP